jgi:hypothetical protein
MRIKNVGASLIVALLLAVMLTGCKSSTASTSKENVSSTDSSSVKSKDGEVKALPEGFPKDIPIINGAQISSAEKDYNGANFSLTYEVKKDFNSVVELYKKYIKDKGYVDPIETDQGDKIILAGKLNKDNFWMRMSKKIDDTSIVQVVIIYTISKN